MTFIPLMFENKIISLYANHILYINIFFFRITMQEAFSEVDISIINRLSSYIYSPDFKISKKSPLNVCKYKIDYCVFLFIYVNHTENKKKRGFIVCYHWFLFTS